MLLNISHSGYFTVMNRDIYLLTEETVVEGFRNYLAGKPSEGHGVSLRGLALIEQMLGFLYSPSKSQSASRLLEIGAIVTIKGQREASCILWLPWRRTPDPPRGIWVQQADFSLTLMIWGIKIPPASWSPTRPSHSYLSSLIHASNEKTILIHWWF